MQIDVEKGLNMHHFICLMPPNGSLIRHMIKIMTLFYQTHWEK